MTVAPEVEAFVAATREFCDRVEAGNYSDLSWLYLQLSKLQLGILQTAAVEPDTNGSSDLDISADEYDSIVSKLHDGLTPDLYWEVVEPLDIEDHEPACGSLRGDVAEIWRDLREGLLNFDAGRTNDAIFDWKFGFETHWGRHLTSALRVLQDHLH